MIAYPVKCNAVVASAKAVERWVKDDIEDDGGLCFIDTLCPVEIRYFDLDSAHYSACMYVLNPLPLYL